MRYSFGDFVLNAETGELLRSGEVVVLRRQTFRLLQLLIERAPALLARDILLDQVWGRTALSPNAVPQAISELRRALGDDPQSPQYIETRHRRGYRFLATVRVEDEPAVDASAGKSVVTAAASDTVYRSLDKHRRWPAIAATAVCVVLVAAWAFSRNYPANHSTMASGAERASSLVLAVLPSEANVPPWVAPTALELFGQHLADSRLRLLRSDALGFADGAQDTRWQHQAHDLLVADHAVGGRWHVDDESNLVLDLSVVDLANGQVVASRRIQGRQENLDALVSEASSVIASALRIAPLDNSDSKQNIQAQDGADYWNGVTEISQGNSEQAASTLAALHERLGKPQWMEAALIKAYVQAGDRHSAVALLEARLTREQELPLGERLRLQAEVAKLRYQPVAAAAANRALVDLYPDDVETWIALVESEIDALQGEAARKSLTHLATRPATRNDPRLTLLRSRIARLDSDFALAGREAEAALQTARQYDLPQLAVAAAMSQAMGMSGQGEIDEAARLLAETDQAWAPRVDSSLLLDLRLRRAHLLREQGHLADAQQILDQLQFVYTADVPRARIGIDAALVQTLSTQPNEGYAILQRIKPVIDRSGDPDLVIGWLNADAITANARNDIDHAQQSFAQAFTLARTSGLAGRHVALQVNAGMAMMRQKRTAEADQLWQQALEVFEALGDRRGKATCLGNLAASASTQGKLERSVELNARALALFRELKLTGPQARTAYNLALAASRDGKLGQAMEYFKEAGDVWQTDGQNDLALRATVGQADIALISGDAAAATRIVDAVAQFEAASPLIHSHLLATQAQIALVHGNLAESRRLHEQALALRKQDGNEAWIALSELELLRNDLLSDTDPVRVQVAAEFLARRFGTFGEVRDEARAWLLVADAQMSRKKFDDARRTLEKVKVATQSFSDLTVAFDLEWAEAWLGDSVERSLRLRSLQARAVEQGYLLQARRAEQALAMASSINTRPGMPRLPMLPYARVGEAQAL